MGRLLDDILPLITKLFIYLSAFNGILLPIIFVALVFLVSSFKSNRRTAVSLLSLLLFSYALFPLMFERIIMNPTEALIHNLTLLLGGVWMTLFVLSEFNQEEETYE